MTKPRYTCILAVWLVAASLPLRLLPLYGEDKPVPADDDALTAELDDELSTIEAEDSLVDEDTVEKQIVEALRQSNHIDYDALEREMEQDHTTVWNVILDAVREAGADAKASGEHLAAVAPSSEKKVNAKEVAKHFVADVRVHHDHVKEQKT